MSDGSAERPPSPGGTGGEVERERLLAEDSLHNTLSELFRSEPSTSTQEAGQNRTGRARSSLRIPLALASALGPLAARTLRASASRAGAAQEAREQRADTDVENGDIENPDAPPRETNGETGVRNGGQLRNLDPQEAERLRSLASVYVPLFAILLLSIFLKYRMALLLVAIAALIHGTANRLVVEEANRLSGARYTHLASAFVVCAFGIACAFALDETGATRAFLLVPFTMHQDSRAQSLFETYHTLFINEVIVCFSVMVVKAVLLAWMPKRSRARLRALGAVTDAGSLVAHLVRFPVWYSYFATQPVIGRAFEIAYTILKTRSTFFFLEAAVYSCRSVVVEPDAPYKAVVAPTDDPLCPICQDEYTRPVALECKHTFCSECIDTWLERERTCPLCRQAVAQQTQRAHSGAHTSVPSLFAM